MLEGSNIFWFGDASEIEQGFSLVIIKDDGRVKSFFILGKIAYHNFEY